ncbi:DUF6000 family protein [Streptomyces sp. HGB0020]|uniref:DUF6000 family protein n=1 Tax=Streptomyces sp. HGB0020 TaxID=1078086 RepID=UPI001F3D1894|nr:DUF6000 family protein [Streptomyces sp. HGB0020]
MTLLSWEFDRRQVKLLRAASTVVLRCAVLIGTETGRRPTRSLVRRLRPYEDAAMHSADDDEAERIELIRRYVTPDRRYLRVGGALVGMRQRERAEFLRNLGKAADEISPRELGMLFDGGWRERKTAAWLVAVAGRTEFRQRLGELLLASEGPYVGQAYCVALATFGTSADVAPLVAYLDRYLRRPDLYYDQEAALGALLLLDARLGTDHAARFLATNGLWQQWIDGPPSKERETPDSYREFIGLLCAFADAAAQHCSTTRRGVTAGSQSARV